MFEEENDLENLDINNEYTPSPETRRHIEKLVSEEKAQKSRDWAYYENLRNTDPAKYWLPKTQVQMHRDAEALGKAFEPSEREANG